MKFWSIFTTLYIGIFLLLCLIFLNNIQEASNIYFYVMTVLFAVSWIIAMKQDGVGTVSRQAIRKFNFHLKSKASQEYLQDDPLMNPNMKDISIKERKKYEWLFPFVVLSTVFFFVSIIIGFMI